jgi:hypothetical protein
MNKQQQTQIQQQIQIAASSTQLALEAPPTAFKAVFMAPHTVHVDSYAPVGIGDSVGIDGNLYYVLDTTQEPGRLALNVRQIIGRLSIDQHTAANQLQSVLKNAPIFSADSSTLTLPLRYSPRVSDVVTITEGLYTLSGIVSQVTNVEIAGEIATLSIAPYRA